MMSLFAWSRLFPEAALGEVGRDRSQLMRSRANPFAIVISGPSGVGKSTFLACIKERYPEFAFSVSVTTRRPRGSERDGVEYSYISRDEFMRKVERGELVEWAEVHGALYGTPIAELERRLQDGRNVLLELDVQGGRNIKRAFPDALLIFILPPSPEELAKRLRGRGTESEEALRLRLHNAAEEIGYAVDYDYVVVNEVREEAGEEVLAIVRGELRRRERVLPAKAIEELALEYREWAQEMEVRPSAVEDSDT